MSKLVKLYTFKYVQLYFKKLGSPAKDKTNKHKTLKQNKSERAAKLECEQETAML